MAVDDVNSVQRKAALKRLRMRADFLIEIQMINDKIRRRVCKDNLIVQPCEGSKLAKSFCRFWPNSWFSKRLYRLWPETYLSAATTDAESNHLLEQFEKKMDKIETVEKKLDILEKKVDQLLNNISYQSK